MRKAWMRKAWMRKAPILRLDPLIRASDGLPELALQKVRITFKHGRGDSITTLVNENTAESHCWKTVAENVV